LASAAPKIFSLRRVFAVARIGAPVYVCHYINSGWPATTTNGAGFLFRSARRGWFRKQIRRLVLSESVGIRTLPEIGHALAGVVGG
jgi:hypothetical protein